MRTRRATAADCPAIAQLVRLYWEFEGLSDFSTERVTALLEELLEYPERGTCWVAEADGVLQAYLLAVYVFSLEHGGMMAEIDEFFALPEARSAGAGTALLTDCAAHMAAFGIIRIQLQLGADNERGRRFYERHGFKPRTGYALWDKPL
jgi:GNAT superfamily N-acetyltransferase